MPPFLESYTPRGCVPGELGYKTGGKHGTQGTVYTDQQDGAVKSWGGKDSWAVS